MYGPKIPEKTVLLTASVDVQNNNWPGIYHQTMKVMAAVLPRKAQQIIVPIDKHMLQSNKIFLHQGRCEC